MDFVDAGELVLRSRVGEKLNVVLVPRSASVRVGSSWELAKVTFYDAEGEEQDFSAFSGGDAYEELIKLAQVAERDLPQFVAVSNAVVERNNGFLALKATDASEVFAGRYTELEEWRQAL